MTPNQIIKRLKSSLQTDDLKSIRKEINVIQNYISTLKPESEILFLNGKTNSTIKQSFIFAELEQILKTRTVERSKYYIQRFLQGIFTIKNSHLNDLNLSRWKEYDDLITDSLWILNKRDSTGVHTAGYWGNFIPQIPNQLLRRFTKKGDWVLDTFAGSGTTLIECKRLGRNGMGIELIPDVAAATKKLLSKEKNSAESITKIIVGDSASVNVKAELAKLKTKTVQLIIMHPPYWDIIKFSDSKKDLSNAGSVEEFLSLFGAVLNNCTPLLEEGRYMAIVIGDKYQKGEWIPLGFYTMQEALKRGFKLKSTIVKNFYTTRGKRNQKELWRYRALSGGFYIFKHEYIFLFQKQSG